MTNNDSAEAPTLVVGVASQDAPRLDAPRLDAARLNAFSMYLSKTLLAKLLVSDKVLAPEMDQFQAAALFADISGFTQLTESLSSQYGDGHAVGAEHLTLMLSDYFDALIEVVFAHYGDVIKFAGDALLILFPHDDSTIAFQRACSCGVAMQSAAATIAESIAREHNVKLSLKVAVSVGNVSGLILGGIFNRWEYAITGEAIVEVGRLGGFADPGDVIVDDGMIKNMSNAALSGLQLISKQPGVSILKNTPSWDLQFAANPLIPHLAMEDNMRSFIPAAVASRIAAGQTDSMLLGELRRVTVLFIYLPQFNADLALDQAQILVSTIQESCYAQRGSIDKLSCDDKGVSVIAGFGLPPMSEQDDAVRAVRAALTMTRLLAALDLQVSIGVATGPVYCGTLGSRFRQEYTLMGDVVNTAARLMQKANLNILCDSRTHQKCSAFIEFRTGVSFNLKGKQAPVTAYAPIAIKKPATNKENSRLNVVVGRTDEQLQMLALFKQVLATSEQVGLFVEGEPGIGKTMLVSVLLDELSDKNNVVLFSSANAVASTLYGIWQNLLLQVLGLDDRNNPQQTLVQLQSYIEKHQLAEFVNPLLPLLNHILGLSLEASELSAKMDNQVKADNTRRLILHLLQPLAAAAPLVIIIDDAHWMDSASWQLILELRRELSNCFFVLLNRPINELNSQIYQKILALDNTTLIQLSRFDNQQLITFVKTKLNVQHVTEQVTELIISRAEGHPLFCEELIKDLSARKIIEISDGRCTLSDDIDLSEELELPATIEMAITARLDRLSIRQQLIIKTASIVGLNFKLSELNYIYPVRAEISFISAELKTLSELGIIQHSQNAMGATYNFSQATLQRIAYDLMLISQRKFLHERVGEWLEQQHQDNLSDYYVSLANHYLKAERYNKAIKYLELAATQSLEAYANKEVVKYLRRAQRLVQEAGLGLAPVTIAHWYNMLGQAYLDLGDMEQAEQCSQQILRTYQHPVPSTTLGMLATITVQILRQFQHRYLPTTLKSLNAKRKAEAGQAAVAAERLFTVYFFSENALGFVYSAISAVNLAERESKLTPILARAYTNFAGGLAIVPLIALADHYAKRASFVAQRVNEGPTTAWLHVVLATYRAGIGRWLEVEMHTQTAMQHAIDLGDQRRWEEAAGTYSITGVLSGKFDSSADEKNIYQQLYQSGIKRGVPQVQAWGLTFRSVVALMQGQNKLAVTSGQALELIVNKYKEQIDPATILESYVCFAKLALLKKQYTLCADWIKASIELSGGKGRSTRFAVVSGYYFLAETALRLYSIKGNTHEGLYLHYVNSSINLLAKCRVIFPIAKSRYLLLRGWFEQLKGRPLKAYKFWLKALPLAQQYHMSYDILLLSLALQNHNVESPLMLNAQETDDQLKKMSIVNKDYLQQWDLKLH